MTKLLFEKDKCKDVVEVNLNNATTYLKNAHNIACSLDALSFSYSGYVASLGSKINSLCDSNEELISWLTNSISRYGNYINENVDSYDKFETVEVKKVESNVNKLY